MEQEQANTNPIGEDKTVAILSYITLIGFIIAVILHGNNKTKLGSYHLRQAFGLVVASLVVWVAFTIIAFIPFINLLLVLLAPLTWIGILVLVILGIINASNDEEKPLPLVGEFFEQKFASMFA